MYQELTCLMCTRGEEEQDERRWWFGEGVPGTYEFSTASGYHHNTYHGPARHLRTPLSLDARPLRFTDSPQHYALTGPPALPPAGASLSGTPAPSPRRKSSSTSNDGSDVSTHVFLFTSKNTKCYLHIFTRNKSTGTVLYTGSLILKYLYSFKLI